LNARILHQRIDRAQKLLSLLRRGHNCLYSRRVDTEMWCVESVIFCAICKRFYHSSLLHSCSCYAFTRRYEKHILRLSSLVHEP